MCGGKRECVGEQENIAIKRKELLTYSRDKERRRFGVAEMEAVPFTPIQPISSSNDDLGISSSLTSASVDDLDIPIAHRKGTMVCTKHPFLILFLTLVCLHPIKLLCRVFLLYLFLIIFRKHCLTLSGSLSWLKR